MDDRGIRRVILAGLLLALTLVMVFTRIGMIPVPTPAGNATISHIPAIIGGLLEGPLVGLLVGMGFGFASFVNATIPMFKDPMVAIAPRLFIGVAAAIVYRLLYRAEKRVLWVLLALLIGLVLVSSWILGQETLWLGIFWAVVAVGGGIGVGLWMQREDVALVRIGLAAGAGSLTNTVLVLLMASIQGYISGGVALGIGMTHGIPELVISALVTVAVVSAVRHLGSRRSARKRGG